MNWNNRVRKIHRWLSIAFTLAVVANIIGNFTTMGHGEPALWVGLLALLPLVLLLLTGLYLFVLPYATRWRSATKLGSP